ncbi:MAG: SPOR domain-containing protein [Acidobacteria bacterium]|nr:SPOR domain-containing protein [Acidobacteriota bacterium]
MGLKRFSIVASAFLVALLLAANAFGQNPNPRPAITEPPRNPTASHLESVKSDRRSKPTAVETVPLPRFAVQVGTYQTRENAEALAQELHSRYQFETLVTPLYLATQDQVYGATRTLHRVRVPVGTKADAEALAARLTREVKLRTWVLPLTRRELNSARAAHKRHPGVLSKTTVQSSSVTLEPYRSMPVETFEQPGAPVQEVDIGQTEPSGSSDVAENTATSEGDAKTNGAIGGVLRVDEDLAATSSDNCYAYELDEKRDWITFNDPSIHFIILPPKSERERLRSHGTPAQIFGMKNCDTVDRTKQVGMYRQPSDALAPVEKIPSTGRVVILAERGNWIRVRDAITNRKGWIRLDHDLVVVKY